MSSLSPSTASSLNNQAEESASVVVFERWWFTAGRQEMLPVRHCSLVAGQGEKEKTGNNFPICGDEFFHSVQIHHHSVNPSETHCHPFYHTAAGHEDPVSAVSVRRQLQLSLCSEGPWGHTVALAFGPHLLVSSLLAHALVALVALSNYTIILEGDGSWPLWQIPLKWGYLEESILFLFGNLFPAARTFFFSMYLAVFKDDKLMESASSYWYRWQQISMEENSTLVRLTSGANSSSTRL